MKWKASLHMNFPASWPPDDGPGHAAERLHWLGRMEAVLRQVVGLEASLWLCSSLAALSVPQTVQAAVFSNLLRRSTQPASSSFESKSEKNNEEQVVKQVVRMLCESRPRQVAALLANDSIMLCRFFSGRPKRVLQWFQNFAGVGETDHQLGGRALTRFAFMHREIFWHELVWQGNRSQAPATVASKPHYFSELDVLKTVNNFLDNVPSFWTSEELRDSLKDGAFLALDVDFFVKELIGRMAGDDLSVWQLVETYIAEESYDVLCQRILPIVSEKNLLEFLNGVGAGIVKWNENTGRRRGQEDGISLVNSSKRIFWLEIVLSAGVKWETLEDAIIYNACASHTRELFRLFQDEEHEEEARLLDSVLSERKTYDENDHWELRQECLVARKSEAVKWLSIEAWYLFYVLSQESMLTLEGLMMENGIGFLRPSDMSTEEIEKDIEQGENKTAKWRKSSRKRNRRKLKGRSKKRHKHSVDSESGSESNSDHSRTAERLNESVVSLRLSLDDYVMTWTKVDIVEHLINQALRSWLQWTARRW